MTQDPHPSDPSALTTAQISNSVSALRDVIKTRLDAMDKAVHLLQEVANRKPTIGELEAKFDGKFGQVDTIFQERAEAVLASLTAQKEAAQEMKALFQTSMNGLNIQVQDLKSRLDRGEGDNAGQREARGDSRNTHLDSRALVFSVTAALAASAAVLVGFLNFAKLH